MKKELTEYGALFRALGIPTGCRYWNFCRAGR